VNCELCERETSAADDWPYLCPGCAADTFDRLDMLPDTYDQLADKLRPLGSNWPKGNRGGTTVYPPMPSTRAMDHRDAFAILPSWHHALFDAMGRPAPALPGDADGRVKAAVRGLQTHRKWATREWPAAGDFAREIRDLFNDVRTVVGEPDLAARMGPCPTVRDRQSCGATLRLPEEAQVIYCPWCGATYPPGVWAALKRAQLAMEQTLNGASDAA
jgi:predicted RNA-binding Zn-ribbon protein involved in translation (DUF1610 family)